MPVQIKICGITRPLDAALAAKLGANYIGINFWPQSKRHVGLDQGCEIAEAARNSVPGVCIVGVFVNQDRAQIKRIAHAANLNYLQLHGDEPPTFCSSFDTTVIKAIPLANQKDIGRLLQYPCETILVDTPSTGYGGSGKTFDWSLATKAVATDKKIFLAGGLTPQNVKAAVVTVRPFGVDVASGVESSPGIKDENRMRQLIAAVQAAG